MTKTEERMFTVRERQLEVHRDFFASLHVAAPEPSDREVAIGEHAFEAGWDACAVSMIGGDGCREERRAEAWSAYTPPEF